jgi:hypothetical protein
MSKWFTVNKMAMNTDETNIIQFITNNSVQYPLNREYDNKHKLVPSLSGACHAVRSLLLIRPFQLHFICPFWLNY